MMIDMSIIMLVVVVPPMIGAGADREPAVGYRLAA